MYNINWFSLWPQQLSTEYVSSLGAFTNYVYKKSWLFKGQTISECPLEILDFPKIPPKIWQISAQETKKWSNHKIKALSYNIYDQICYLMY